MDKPKVIVSISLLFLFVIAAIILHFDTKLQDAQTQFEEASKEERQENERTIDSLFTSIDSAAVKIKSLKIEKKLIDKDILAIKRKLEIYEEPRYFPDASFNTESQRIARSRYRHDK